MKNSEGEEIRRHADQNPGTKLPAAQAIERDAAPKSMRNYVHDDMVHPSDAFSIVAATLQLRFEFTKEARSAQRKNFIKKYSETLRPLGPCREDDSENSHR